MYITKLTLNLEDYRVQKELGNPYQLHRTIMNAFSDNLKNVDRDGRILFRIEANGRTNAAKVLIQSCLCPDWNFLLEDGTYLLRGPLFKQFKYPEFKEGNKFWFRLFCNPTKKTEGKRVGLFNEEEQFDWLNRKAKNGGFQINHVSITKREEITAKVRRNTPTMTFFGVQFEGVLEVLDPDNFSETLKSGIGSGKAFGFGFLTISTL